LPTETLIPARRIQPVFDLVPFDPPADGGALVPAELDAARSYAENEKAASTRVGYSRDWNAFRAWWVGRPNRAKTYGKKREHGPNSYGFSPKTLDALLSRHKAPDYCVQLLRAICIGWHIPATAGVLHAITWGPNAGDDIACNTGGASSANPGE
jgi:hypothetical protein